MAEEYADRKTAESGNDGGQSDGEGRADRETTAVPENFRRKAPRAAERVRNLTEMAMMLALIETVKRALDFLPNVELVAFLFLVFTILYGRKTILVSLAFTGVETLVFGSGIWVIMYLYVWPLEILCVLLLHRHFPKDLDGYWWYCIFSALFGLFFGAACTVPYWIMGGPKAAIAWWIAGIPYDIVHGVSNFILCLILFRPVMRAARKIGLGQHRIQ